MDMTPSAVTNTNRTRLGQLLDRPLPGRQCVLGWIVATVIFVGACALLGGPTTNDASESTYSTWAVGHGDFACSYAPVPGGRVFLPSYHPGPYMPSLWPLVSGGLAAVTGVGNAVPFPSSSAMGTDCAHASVAMYHWAHKSRALFATIGFGYFAWFAVLAGVVALLRAAGRGRTGWEVAGVVMVALTPALWATLINEYHPQDLLAVGLILCGLACAIRRSWLWSGVLFGLAVSSQQFALLALVPLFVVAPARGSWRLAGGAALAAVLVALPFVATSKHAWHAVTIGTGNTPSYGGTAVRYLHLHGTPLVAVSRVLPIVVAAALAWWLHRRLGPRALEPIPLLALMAISLSMRLVFEQNLFGYYFMALAVFLILAAVVEGRIRGELVAWITLVGVEFDPVPWGLAYNARSWGMHVAVTLPQIGLAIALGLIVWDAAHRRVRWYVVAWFAVVAADFAQWPPWSQQWAPLQGWQSILLHPWSMQLILVPTGILLAVWPLVDYLRSTPKPERLDHPGPKRAPLDVRPEGLGSRGDAPVDRAPADVEPART